MLLNLKHHLIYQKLLEYVYEKQKFHILILHYDEQDTLLYNIDLTAELKEQIKYWSDYQLVWVQKEIARSIQAIEANANLKLIIEAMLIKVIDELQRR